MCVYVCVPAPYLLLMKSLQVSDEVWSDNTGGGRGRGGNGGREGWWDGGEGGGLKNEGRRLRSNPIN